MADIDSLNLDPIIQREILKKAFGGDSKKSQLEALRAMQEAGGTTSLLGDIATGLSQLFRPGGDPYGAMTAQQDKRFARQKALASMLEEPKIDLSDLITVQKYLRGDQPTEYQQAKDDMKKEFNPLTGKMEWKKTPKEPSEFEIWRRQNAQAEAEAKKEKAEYEKTPKGRLEKASGDKQQKIGFIASALNNVDNYIDQFNAGERQGRITPQAPIIGEGMLNLVSSTPIDEARTNLEEAIGRLASGGAIGHKEELRFRSMIPTAGDTDEAAARKLKNLRNEMNIKLKGYGFDSVDLPSMGFEFKNIEPSFKKQKIEKTTKTSAGLDVLSDAEKVELENLRKKYGSKK